MRESRDHDDSDNQFSSVESVSQTLFDRVSGTQNLTVAYSALPEAKGHQATADAPFSAIENVSSQIFDRMNVLEQPEETTAPADRTMQGWVLVRADEIGSVPGARETDSARTFSTETSADHGIPNPNVSDVGYRAAQRRSQLPDGVEPIEGAPTKVNELSMLDSIRKLMVEQKRDFNKTAFPELEPVHESSGAHGARIGNDQEVEAFEEYEEIAPNRFRTAVMKFVRADTVLAICLSIWVSLLLMIFIDPGLSQALAIMSLILLFIYKLMQPVHKKRRVVKFTKRRANGHDLALEDALLCQDR